MRHTLVCSLVSFLLLALTQITAGQDGTTQHQKPAARSSLAMCDGLLQHPLAWWLSSAPTAVERDQLSACMSAPGLPVTSAPSATTTSGVARPTNWNILTADQQATWARLAPKTWREMTPGEQGEWTQILSIGQTAAPPQPAHVSNDVAYQRYLRTRLRKTTDDGKEVINPRHFSQTEWELYCAGHQSDTGTCQGWMPGAVVATAPQLAQWTSDACESERQSLSLLSERVKQDIAQLQVLATMPTIGSTATSPTPPPTYRCDSSTLGSRTTATCEPEARYTSPGAAAAQAFEQSMAEQTAQKRWDALAAPVRAEQSQFNARMGAWNSHCASR
jgi:hypothetical protein